MTTADQALPEVQTAFDRARLANHDSFYAVRLPKTKETETYHRQLVLFLGVIVSPAKNVQDGGTDYIEFMVNKTGLSSSKHPHAAELKAFIDPAVEGLSISHTRPFKWTPPISVVR